MLDSYFGTSTASIDNNNPQEKFSPAMTANQVRETKHTIIFKSKLGYLQAVVTSKFREEKEKVNGLLQLRLIFLVLLLMEQGSGSVQGQTTKVDDPTD